LIGRIARWDEAHGFGFVTIGNDVRDFIFIRSGLQTEVVVGDHVDFWLHDNPEGGLLAAEIATRDGLGKPYLTMRLFVTCVPPATPDAELQASLETVGPVLRILRKADDYGFVDFADRANAEAALNGTRQVRIDGTRLVFRLPRNGPC
jgi:cold shock CspA family protein